MSRSAVFLLLLLSVFVAHAKDIPDELAVWSDWVKHDQAYRNCPHFANQNTGSRSSHVCAWPQQLVMNVGKQGAAFSVTWELLEDSWVPLPGNEDTWPQQVMVNNRSVAVQQQKTFPRVYLPKGVHTLEGRFIWQSRPEAINVPAEMADVSLTLDDVPVKFPVIQNHSLWFGEAISEEKVEANSVDIEVNRLIIDGHPMTVFMAIDLQVSGVARNEKLGRVMSADYQITDVGGDLNAYVDQAGDLWAQLKPGYNEILIGMNIKGWPSQLAFEPSGDAWPRQEIWAYQDNKNIRLTQVEGVTAINPEQSSSRWDQVPNFLLNAGDVFVINEQKRGTLNQSEQLSLSREAWLSFDGETYRTKDHITGDKFGSWRLNAESSLELLSARTKGEDLLITQSVAGDQGVELREPNVSLNIEGEMGAAFKHTISGWDINLDAVRTKLHLPHGYLALATNNVDHSNNVWLEQWRLWDIFIIMLLTVLSFKVIGIKSAVFAFVTLILGYQGFGLPLYSWANLILALALIAWIPKGRWLRLLQSYAVLSVLGLVVLLLPHLVEQARLSIHPQLENQRSVQSDSGFYSPVKKAERSSQVHQQTYNVDNAINADGLYMNEAEEQGKITVTGSRIKRSDMINRYQTDAVLQAGKGTPVWRYNSVELQWDGPITAEQSYRLVLLTPWMRVVWRLLLIVAAALWLLSIITHMRKLFKQKATASVTTLFWVFALCLAQTAGASTYPPENLLQELQSRLFPAAKCQPNCVSLETASVVLSDHQLTLGLTHHALDDVVVPLPQSTDWQITGLRVNGVPQPNRLQHQNQPWIRLNQGLNQVEISVVLAKRNNISIQFPVKPGQLTTAAENWQFAGLDGYNLTGNTLQLIATNQRNDSGTDERPTNTEIAAFVKLERSITFDDQWYVNNLVTRVAPKQGVLNVTIPLLDNEFPMEKLQQNEASDVVVNLAPDEQAFGWRSRLERVPKFSLQAAENRHYLEQWRIVSSPQWHVDISGVPMVASADLANNYDDYFVHVYLPRPNEAIEVEVTRPAAVAGSMLAIDAIDNIYSVGKRTTKVDSKIKYRATQGGRFAVNLDPSAEVKKVTFDGVESNLINEGGVVSVSFLPGTHQVNIEWHVTQELGLYTKTPSIQLAADFSNLSQTVKVPRDRWLLWGGSSGVGPAFLYWGELLVFGLLALLLARVKYSPLKTWQWLVLGCAFGTFSWLAFSVVAVWLFYVGWKQQFSGFVTRGKNILLQWFSLIFTLVALLVLVGAVAFGLLSYPDMGIAGKMSSATQLHWYLDAGSQQVPAVGLLSVHLWWYKLLILLWSIWVSFAVLGWLKQLLQSLRQGDWWPDLKAKKQPTAAQVTQPKGEPKVESEQADKNQPSGVGPKDPDN